MLTSPTRALPGRAALLLEFAASGALAACTPSPPVAPRAPEPVRMLAELPALGCWLPAPSAVPLTASAAAAPEPPPDAPVCEDLGKVEASDGTVRVRCGPGTDFRRAGSGSGYDERWCARPDGTRHGDHVQCLKVAGALRVQERGQYEEGKKTGAWVVYAGAHRQAEQAYRNGKLHGASRTFYPGGQLAGLSEYRDGLLHGERGSWARNGTRTEEGHYDGGLAHGIFRQWAPDGGNPVRHSHEAEVHQMTHVVAPG